MYRYLALAILTAVSLSLFARSAASDFYFEVGQMVPDAVVEAVEKATEKKSSDVTLIQLVGCDSERAEESLLAIEDFVWQSNKDRSFRVVAIGAGCSPEAVEELKKSTNLTFPVIADPDRNLFDRFASFGVPRTVILDSDNNVVYLRSGYRRGREAEFRAVVEGVLNGVEPPANLSGGNKSGGGLTMRKVDPPKHALSVVGKQAPEVPVETWITSQPKDMAGKYVLVDFRATWCGPCIMALREGEKLHGKFEDKLVTIAVSDEPASKVQQFVMKEKWRQPIAVDTQSRAKDALQVRAIPHAFLKDPNGMVVWEGHPMALWHNDGALLKEFLK